MKRLIACLFLCSVLLALGASQADAGLKGIVDFKTPRPAFIKERIAGLEKGGWAGIFGWGSGSFFSGGKETNFLWVVRSNSDGQIYIEANILLPAVCLWEIEKIEGPIGSWWTILSPSRTNGVRTLIGATRIWPEVYCDYSKGRWNCRPREALDQIVADMNKLFSVEMTIFEYFEEE